MFIKVDAEGRQILTRIFDVAWKHDVLGGEAIAPYVNKAKALMMQPENKTKPKKNVGNKGTSDG